MQLILVSDYVGQARVLLQDTVSPYRYDDEGLVTALNNGWLEITKNRPDILLDLKYQTRMARNQPVVTLDSYTPNYSATTQTAAVLMPAAYKLALLYYICGFAQLRDMQEVQDSRALLFMTSFRKELLVLQ